MCPSTPLRWKCNVSPSHSLLIANFLPIAFAVLSTAALAAFSEPACLRRISILATRISSRAAVMMPETGGGGKRASLAVESAGAVAGLCAGGDDRRSYRPDGRRQAAARRGSAGRDRIFPSE